MSNKKSKIVLITGASSGFGRDTAETLAHAGHTVFASMRDVNGKHRDQANKLRQQGIAVVELDVSDDDSVDAAVKEVLARAKRIDVLVNNAGIASAGVTEAFTAEQANVIFNTNVVGLLRTSRAALPAMRAQGDGLIINIGSILGRVTFPFFGIYGASKFAVEALTESLRYEVSQLGIEVVRVLAVIDELDDDFPRLHLAAREAVAELPRDDLDARGRLRRRWRDPRQDVRDLQGPVRIRKGARPA